MARSTKIPSYRLHKPTNQAIVVLGGKMFYLGRYGSVESRDEYNRLIQLWLAKSPVSTLSHGTKSLASDLTISELILAYWRHVEAYYRKDGKPTSQIHVVHLALKPVRKLYGHTLAKDFGPIALKACRNVLVDRGLTRKSINSLVSRMRQMFKWAAEQELLPVTIHQSLTAVAALKKGRTTAKEMPPIAPIEDAIVEKTLPHLPKTVATMVRLQWLTGMRPGEVIQMRTGNLNTSGAIWEYKPGSHKTEHHEQERTIFLGPQAQDVLKPWLRLDLHASLFSPDRSEAERETSRRSNRKSKLWPSHVAHQAKKRKTRHRRVLGDRYSVASYRRAIARACDLAFPHPTLAQIPAKELTAEQRAELKAWRKAHRWHPHQLRHTVATRIRHRFGLEAAQVVLGHSELGTTQLYAEKNLNAAREVMREIG